MWIELVENNISYNIEVFFIWIPIYPHLHNDKENGQLEQHYHRDTRFDSPNYIPVRLVPGLDGVTDIIENKLAKCISTTEKVITPIEFIKKSKLKHKCIHKGKCPHRGYDLSEESAIDGVITCPLHGLKFDEMTGRIINF